MNGPTVEGPVLVTCRSGSTTVLETAAELLALFGSPVEVAVAVLVMVPVAFDATVAVTLQVSSAPDVMVMFVPVMFPVPLAAGQLAPATVVEHVHDQAEIPVGRLSVMDAVVVVPGPLFLRRTV